MKPPLINLLIIASALYATNSCADIKTKTDPETQLQSWTLSDGNFELKIAQLLPDQTRAFYIARGFSKEIADDIATNCMMQTIAKNTAAKKSENAITIYLKEWQIKTKNHSKADSKKKLQGIKLKETWDNEWGKDTVTPAARIAFRWATFPTEQTYEPNGDYNWGTNSFGLSPNSLFDLNVVWHQGNAIKNVWIKNISCAEDR